MLLLFSFLLLLVLILSTDGGWGIWVFALIGGVSYVEAMVLKPLRTSRPARAGEGDMPLLNGIAIRISTTRPTHVIRQWRKAVLIVNKWDLENGSGIWRGMACHEYCHLSMGDLRYFNMLGILASALIALALAPTIGMVLGLVNGTGEPVAALFAGYMAVFIGVPLALLASVIRNSLHMREFAADYFAMTLEPEATLNWLQRAARRERCAHWSRRYLSGAFLSHPRFSSRLAQARLGVAANTPVWGSAVDAFLVFLLSIYLLFGLAWALQSVDGVRLPVALALAMLGVLGFLSGTPLAYCSLQTERIVRQSGARAGLRFCLAFSALLFGLYLLASLSVDITGFGQSEASLERLRLVFPDAPGLPTPSSFWREALDVLLVVLLLPLYCLLWNILLGPRAGKLYDRFRGAIHIVIGLISVLMVSLTMKALHGFVPLPAGL